MRTETGQPIRLSDYAPPDWLVDKVDLDFSLHPSQTRVRAVLSLKPNTHGTPAPLVLDGDGLTLVSLKLDGADVPADSYLASPHRLTIPQPPQRPFTLEIETVVDPTANTQLSGLFRSSGIYCTQCEPEGFRRITYFPDRPDVMAVYSTRIEADKSEAPVLLANGNLVDRGDLAGGWHYAVWQDPFPKPSYLFALVGGRLGCVEDRFVTASGRDVALKIYVEPGKEDRCAYAMDALKRSMRWDEQAFGREYDLDIFMIVAVSDFNMGAMENKGLNVFNDKYILASSDTATDGDYAGIESVVAHEYFHNWTGNRITCRDWFQLCLKEGLTVFRDQEFTADQRSRAVKRIADVRGLRNAQFVEDAGPLAHPVRPDTYKEINNFYTNTVYEKGAELVRMIKTLIGAKTFRDGMDLYFQRHDGEAATVEQFLRCFADASGRDLSQFMRWYEQAGTSQVKVRGQYDEKARKFSVTCTQITPPTPGQPVKQPMVIPLSLGLVGDDGRDLPLRLDDGSTVENGVVVLSEATKTFVFSGISRRPVVSINRGFSAPIKLITDLSCDDLAFLAAHDSDPFNRWQAIQSIAMAFLIDSVTGNAGRNDATLIEALESVLRDRALEPAFIALALTPPGEADIAREIGKNIDPDAIFKARLKLRANIGEQLGQLLAETYERMKLECDYSPDAESAGNRALGNTALDLLAAGGKPDALARAERQFDTADNMTDRFSALATLSLHDTPVRERVLADFYNLYSGHALVVDKWFALQAMIPEPKTLGRVRSLTRHPAFEFTNPNRLRSLIGSFAQGNPSQFNRADGAGYDFVAETVLALDPKNPQVAARLATAFRTWRNMDAPRRVKAGAALERIKAGASLSHDVSEIVERSLEAPQPHTNPG
jgi:aminopeptidase N